MSQNYSDAELVDLYKASKDTAHLTVLFTRHSDIAYRSALRIMKNSADAEDVLQTSYCKMIRDLHLFNGTGSVLGWMLQVIIHTCYKQKQSEKSRQNREKIIMSERPQMANPKNNELSEMMENHLNKLPEIYKVPITLQIMEGLSIWEVSQALEIPEKTIRSQIARGLEKLKVSLQNVGFTASVISIGDLLKEVPMAKAPEAIKTSSYFNSIFQAKATASTKLAISSSAKSFVIPKIITALFFSCLTIGAIYMYGKKPDVSVTPSSMIQQKWAFENTSDVSEYQNINLVSGGITIVKSMGVNDSNGLVTDAETVLEINISKFKLPLRVSYQTDLLLASASLGQMFIKSDYQNDKKIAYLSDLRERIELPAPNGTLSSKLGFMGKWYSHVFYIDENGVDLWVDGKRSHLMLGRSNDNNRIYFYVKGQSIIDELKIESIDKNVLPSRTDCVNLIESVPYQKGIEKYSLDKEKLGFKKNDNVNPSLSLIDAEFFKNNLIDMNKFIVARLGESNKVEWTKVRKKELKKLFFDNPEDLKMLNVIRGDVKIVKMKGVDSSSALSVSAESLIEIDISSFQLPIKITQPFDNQLPPGAKGNGILVVKSNYDIQKNIFNFTNLSVMKTIDTSESAKKNKNENVKSGYFGEWFIRTIYVSDDCVESWLWGERSGVLFGRSYDNSKIYLLVKDQSIFDNLTIESIAPSEVPDHSIYQKFTEKLPFKRGYTAYNLENDMSQLGISKENDTRLAIYDKHALEQSLAPKK